MNESFMSFIVKDLSICSDNLINIQYNKIFNINCTCGIEYCDHCDYILKCILKCINHEIDYSNKDYRLINLKNNESLEFKIKDIINDYIHNIELFYKNEQFHLRCACQNKVCRSSEYALLSFLLRYNEKKHKHNFLNIEKEFT
jgi:hypothetical protein